MVAENGQRLDKEPILGIADVSRKRVLWPRDISLIYGGYIWYPNFLFLEQTDLHASLFFANRPNMFGFYRFEMYFSLCIFMPLKLLLLGNFQKVLAILLLYGNIHGCFALCLCSCIFISCVYGKLCQFAFSLYNAYCTIYGGFPVR